jgi:hypothetical protein
VITGNQTLSIAVIAAEQLKYGHIDFNDTTQSNNFGQASIEKRELPFIQGVTIYGNHFGCDKINRLAREGVQIGTNSRHNYLNLEKGNILLHPEKSLVVATHAGNIHISPGATIFVMESDKTVIVYDLLQARPKQVFIVNSTIVNKSKIVLDAGCMLVLTKQNVQDFEQLEMNARVIAYKNAKLLNWHDDKMSVFMANFSIASALAIIEPLKCLAASDHKFDKLVLAQLAKGAIILEDSAVLIKPSKTVLAQLRYSKKERSDSKL